jgi:dynein light chain 1
MSLKATTVKEALRLFEEKFGVKASDESHVKLWGMLPPIEKMDASLGALGGCAHLSLSTNSIDKISNLSGLHNLRILSLGRNNIKKLENLDPVANTLEELWISYNNIERLTGSVAGVCFFLFCFVFLFC